MNTKAMIPLIVAVVLGGLALKLGKDMMDRRKGNGAEQHAAKIVVAKNDIAPGTVVKDTDIGSADAPPGGTPANTFSLPAEIVGRVVALPVVKGQMIMENVLAPKHIMAGPGMLVPDGMRAITMEINESSGVAGLLTPGCTVDIVQTIRGKDDEKSMMAKTIVENLRVWAVGRRLSGAGPDGEQIAKSVTLLATQEQAEIIDLAAHLGAPRLVLRNSLDNKVLGGKGITVAQLSGNKDNDCSAGMGLIQKIFTPGTATPTAPLLDVKKDEKPEPEFRVVEIIRGGTSATVKFPLLPNASLTSNSDKLEPAVPGEQE